MRQPVPNARLAPGGMSADRVLAEIGELQQQDTDWEGGRAWAYVYHPGDDVLKMRREAYLLEFESNGLSPRAFPSLVLMEKEVVSMSASLLHAPAGATGSITSGGSESILLAIKAHRDHARQKRPDLIEPEMVLPWTAHPGFDKAAHYLGVRSIRVQVGQDQVADPEAMEASITDRTILLVGSAPSYPHGVVDPIPDLARVARHHMLPLHVDACVGGFVLPFARELGRTFPDFDFSVDGVTTISADLHKYGYAAKGASLVLHRSEETFAHQRFIFNDWPGSQYEAPNMTGTRPGGSIAAAWAVMRFLGEEGYRDLTARALAATDRLIEGICGMSGCYVLGDPSATVIAFGCADVDIADVGAHLQEAGWVLSLQRSPDCLHLTVSPHHDHVVDAFLGSLTNALDQVRQGDTGKAGQMEAKYS
jgi:sphinganine-1-phosphate aldolase